MTTATTTTWTRITDYTYGNGYSHRVDETLATFTGFGEFYSGLHNGDLVTVHRTTAFDPEGNVVRVSYAARTRGPWLGVVESALQF
jgi:hypothetical protein